NTYNALKQYDEARGWCNKAIALDSKHILAYSYKGDSFQGEGKYEEAIKEYNKAIARDPHFQEALDNKKAALEAIVSQASNKDFEILLKNTPLLRPSCWIYL
uniref:tetratricopeptide repeat protein n=1 Tax=Clostridium sp. TaxID=1506 RepID=UPI0035A1A4FD